MKKMTVLIAGLALSGAAAAADLDVLGSADYQEVTAQEMSQTQGQLSLNVALFTSSANAINIGPGGTFAGGSSDANAISVLGLGGASGGGSTSVAVALTAFPF